MTAWLDATDQAELIRSGEASPAELVEAAIERIERLDPQINAVIEPRFEQARKEAVNAPRDGPFRGVPLLLKDLGIASLGDPYHRGCRALKAAGVRADHDSALTRRFRDAGFVIVGRTNTPENGSTITTEPLAYGPCRNPWNPGYSTGGSSGGSGAAVAAGFTAVAHGNDGGGSIRIPASECGIVGLKPSRGRVSQAPDHGEQWMGGVIDGVLTRTVRDTARILDLISGPEPGDPYVAPLPLRPWADEVGADPGRLRIGLLDHPLLAGAQGHPECAAAVAGAGRLLDSLGHAVDQSYPEALGDEAFQGHFLNVVACANASDFAAWEAILGRPLGEDDLEPHNQMMRAIGLGVSGPAYLSSVDWLYGYTRRVDRWWSDDGYDVLVTPVLGGPPPPIGWLSDPEQGMARILDLMQYTAQFNITGQPGISLPLHWTADGLPVGVQFVAAYGREDVLVRLAAQIEAAQPWADRRPPLAA
jgi:amidase